MDGNHLVFRGICDIPYPDQNRSQEIYTSSSEFCRWLFVLQIHVTGDFLHDKNMRGNVSSFPFSNEVHVRVRGIPATSDASTPGKQGLRDNSNATSSYTSMFDESNVSRHPP